MRLAAAVLAVGVIVSAVVIVIAQRGPGPADAAPVECLDKWNGDPTSLSYTRHNATFHDYENAQVAYFDGEGGASTATPEPNAGTCAVIFPRAAPDPEIVAAGKVYMSEQWTPLSEVVGADTVAAMQAAAVKAANARLTPSGELEPLR